LDRPGHTTFAIALLATGALAISACGRNNADLVEGKKLFVANCGACHEMARAETKGTQGPNLDHAFVQDRIDGMNAKTIEGVARHQIAYPRRGSIMPANLVKGQQADDVAAYVGYAAGKPGKDQGELAAAGQANVSNKPAIAKAGKLVIPAIDGTAFAYKTAIAQAGSVTFDMPNKSPIGHDISIKGNGVDQHGKVVPQGGTSNFTITLKPGKYEFYCSVPGHEAAGMKGTLTVK
jgi:plastocyanin